MVHSILFGSMDKTMTHPLKPEPDQISVFYLTLDNQESRSTLSIFPTNPLSIN